MSIKKFKHCFLISLTYLARWLMALIPAILTSIESSSSISKSIPVTWAGPWTPSLAISMFWPDWPAPFLPLLFIICIWLWPPPPAFGYWPIWTNFYWKKLSFCIIWTTVGSGIYLSSWRSPAQKILMAFTMALIYVHNYLTASLTSVGSLLLLSTIILNISFLTSMFSSLNTLRHTSSTYISLTQIQFLLFRQNLVGYANIESGCRWV